MIKFKILQFGLEALLQAIRNNCLRYSRTFLRNGSGFRFLDALTVCGYLLFVLYVLKESLLVVSKQNSRAKFLLFIG
jgi:hypothetical protein